ncbi:U3 small nucleolar RNA-associated protein 18 homolog [Nasonia vitripennis]|uniref:U3 small nucleolar RNA-associated protein 18 homolog n=1 Tax=Nasonia vitripennis TaxID=7425 RepID=A0A7M7G941_NASVI|nr:U3 small nucleolar RNA-associated protein 18 homolog [Nasonia vitripennis]
MGSENKDAVDEFARPRRPKLKKKRSRTDSEASTASVEIKSTMLVDPIKRKRRNIYNPEEESRLERLVFGDPSDIIQNLKSDVESEAEPEPMLKHESSSDSGESEPEPEEDDDADDDASIIIQSDKAASIITVDSKSTVTAGTAAWMDEDDEELLQDALIEQNRRLPKGRTEKKYSELLQNKYSHIVGTPKWAKLNRENDEDSDDSDSEILKHSNHIVPKKTKALSKGNIDLKVLTQINKQTHMEGPFVNSVQFHEQSTVALVAGSSGVLSLFEIDGRENNKLHTMKFHRFPIHTARFLKEGTEVLVGSMSHAFCHSYDLISGKTQQIPLPHGITNMKKFEISPDGKLIAICGRLGEIHLLSSKTKEMIGTMKMNKKCRSLAFTPDSTKIISHGESSEIYVWDVKSRTCDNRAFDDGCLSACSIAMSPSGQFIATGSKQGAVNLYDAKSVLTERTPTPVKTVLNLVTAITKLEFNPTSEILAMASDRKANAFKMLHLPSFNVFANFPTFNTKMFNPLDIDFSPGSGYMSVSNNKGFAYLYRLKHYGNY